MPNILDKSGTLLSNKITFNSPSTSKRMGLPLFVELGEFFYDKDIQVNLLRAGKTRTLVLGKDYFPYGVVAGLRATNGARIFAGLIIPAWVAATETVQVIAQIVGGTTVPPDDIESVFFRNPTSRNLPAVVKSDGNALTFTDLDSESSTKVVLLNSGDSLWTIERNLIEQGRLVETVQTPTTDTTTQQPTIPTTTTPVTGEQPSTGTGKPAGGWTMSDLSVATQAEIAKGAAAVPSNQKGTANGVAPLNAQGYIPLAHMDPRVLISYLGEVSSQAAMLALTGEQGDWCIRTDINPGTGARFDLIATPASNLASWKQAPDRTGVVTVNAPSNISASRDLASTDANKTYFITSASLNLGIPAGLNIEDGIAIKPHSGGTTFTPASGVRINGSTAAVTITLASDTQFAYLTRTPVANEYDLLIGGRQAGTSAPSQTAGVQIPTFSSTPDTAGRTLTSADLNNKLIRYNASANGSLIIPTDAALGITDATQNVQIAIYQMGTGRMDVVADTANGVTLRRYAGYPTPAQYTTEFYHRVGPNTWALL